MNDTVKDKQRFSESLKSNFDNGLKLEYESRNDSHSLTNNKVNS